MGLTKSQAQTFLNDVSKRGKFRYVSDKDKAKELYDIALAKGILPGIAKKSMVEGHFGGQKEFYAELFKKQTYKDAWKLRKETQSRIDDLYGEIKRSESNYIILFSLISV